ncbi:hypothetical protein TCAL_07323, partial [Tigriopus californicus]|eukprot:TCALIF_07323-PA protein Name:"Protein of unknown function" AED:0.03 eAED:0.17 QI:20/0.5/0.33/1/0/0/3/0/117
MIVPFTLLLVFGLWNNNLVSSQATDPTYSQWNIKVEYDQFGGTPPKCLAECNTSCVQGESLCFANLIHVDTPDKKLNPLDEKFYVHCMCSKSTIRRDPGLDHLSRSNNHSHNHNHYH